MKIFVATKETQGQRSNDFSHADEGVIVTFGSLECDGESVDGKCGCKRSMSGIEGGATTTFKVVDSPEINAERYTALVVESFRVGGWLDDDDDSSMLALVKNDARDLLAMANRFPVGTVLERRGSAIQSRPTTSDADRKATITKQITAWANERNLTPEQIRKQADTQRGKAKRARDPFKKSGYTLTAECFDLLALQASQAVAK